MVQSSIPTGHVETVYIPAGEFPMGPQDGLGKPVVTMVDASSIYRYEVTNAQYAAFLNMRGSEEMCGGNRCINLFGQEDADGTGIEKIDAGEFQVQNGFENLPVVNVSWGGAQAFCEANGGSLPTEAQWEKAARGTTPKAYPWG